MDDDGNGSVDEVSSGRERAGSRGRPFSGGGPTGFVTILAVVGLTAAIVVMEARRTDRPPSPPGPVEVYGSELVSFPLRGGEDAELGVLYQSQQGGRPSVAISVEADVKQGVDYRVTAGECRGRKPHVLTHANGKPDSVGFLLLTLTNMPGSERTVVWVRVANGYGRQLGGVRSPFKATGFGVQVAPGKPVCPLVPVFVSAGSLGEEGGRHALGHAHPPGVQYEFLHLLPVDRAEPNVHPVVAEI